MPIRWWCYYFSLGTHKTLFWSELRSDLTGVNQDLYLWTVNIRTPPPLHYNQVTLFTSVKISTLPFRGFTIKHHYFLILKHAGPRPRLVLGSASRCLQSLGILALGSVRDLSLPPSDLSIICMCGLGFWVFLGLPMYSLLTSGFWGGIVVVVGVSHPYS